MEARRTPRRGGGFQLNAQHVQQWSGATLSRLPELTPCFRWHGLVGKGRAGVLYVLEVFGEQDLEELGERLGFSRLRDLRRLYLEPLVELGIIEDRGGIYALPGQERYVKRVEEVRTARHGGGPRKVRCKDQLGRMVTREVEREEGDRLRYEAQRHGYRSGGRRPSQFPNAPRRS